MSEACSQLVSVLDAPQGPRDPGGWLEHLDHCGRCRALWLTHREMRRLSAALPEPRLQHGFNARLRRRLRQDSARRPAVRIAATVAMSIYWLLAAAASAFIMLQVGSAGLVTLVSWISPLWLIPLLVSPFLWLGRPLQTRWLISALAAAFGPRLSSEVNR